MATGREKSTKDLVDGTARCESGAEAAVPRSTRVLRPAPGGAEVFDTSLREWEDVCRERGFDASALSPDLEMLASDRKSERLVTLWIDEILGEDTSSIAAGRPAPSFHGEAVSAPHVLKKRPSISTKRRVFRLSPGRRAAACLLGVAGILAVAFVAVPAPRGIRAAIFENVGLLPASIAQKIGPVPPTVSVTMLAPGSQASWLDPAIARFNRGNPDGFHVTRLAMPDANQGVVAVLDGEASPAIFASNRAGDMKRLNEGWLRERHGWLIADIDDPLAFRRVSRLPMVVLNAPWVDARRRAGGIAFLEFLAKERADAGK